MIFRTESADLVRRWCALQSGSRTNQDLSSAVNLPLKAAPGLAQARERRSGLASDFVDREGALSHCGFTRIGEDLDGRSDGRTCAESSTAGLADSGKNDKILLDDYLKMFNPMTSHEEVAGGRTDLRNAHCRQNRSGKRVLLDERQGVR
jgi:hypothetical protein